MMKWVYLSPHLDDVVYSCGGVIWEQVQSGAAVEIWTICAGKGEPPFSAFTNSLHERWGTGPEAVEVRRAEDLLACREVGAVARHFDIPDCIYRRLPATGGAVVRAEEDLFSPLHPGENGLIEELTLYLMKSLDAAAKVVSPLTVGGHIDHRLTRAAAEALRRPLSYYADYPYVAREGVHLSAFTEPDWGVDTFPITEEGLNAWQRGAGAYLSQISTFWGGLDDMKAALRAYWEGAHSGRLWRSPQI